MMIVSLNVSLELFIKYKINADAERIAAQVVSGIGFLGAGTILANEKSKVIRGLTTAANLWAVAGRISNRCWLLGCCLCNNFPRLYHFNYFGRDSKK